jgi:hypothetical protein
MSSKRVAKKEMRGTSVQMERWRSPNGIKAPILKSMKRK